MKQDQRGFTYIELVVAAAIMMFIAGALTMTIFSVLKESGRTSERMTAIRQVENAGSWISRDALMAGSISTENLTSPDLLILNWTEWGYDEDSIYHSITYSIEDIADSIGKLMRTHQDSQGANEQTLVANYIYYNPGDPDNSSNVSYQAPLLDLKIASVFNDTRETREYKINRRPNLQ